MTDHLYSLCFYCTCLNRRKAADKGEKPPPKVEEPNNVRAP